MFGYVTIYKPELKMKDFYQYKAYYCGLCKTLKERYGRFGQMTLTYDLTFLIILLTSLYERELTREGHHCIIHPLKKHEMVWNEISEYAADMNIALTYHHFLDDWEDEKNLSGFLGTFVLRHKYKRIYKQYPRQCEKIVECLKTLQVCEKNEESNLDQVSRSFGELMAELFVFRQDQWEEPLRRLGFFLGKFIYFMDAYEDLEKDKKKGNYNPLKSLAKKESYEADCENILVMMMAECTSAFEKLPCLLHGDILKNILYEGVWVKYDKIQTEKKERGTNV